MLVHRIFEWSTGQAVWCHHPQWWKYDRRNIFGTVLASWNSQPSQLIVETCLFIKLQLFQMKLATTTSEEVVENLPIISEPLVAAWKCFTGASWPLGVSMSPPAPPLWVPSSSPHDVCSGRGRLMVTSLQYCNEWVLPIPILCWFPLPPHSFVSCVGNGHVVLESHLLDNGSVLPSDDQGKLILDPTFFQGPWTPLHLNFLQGGKAGDHSRKNT